jgi:hypothetical protein
VRSQRRAPQTVTLVHVTTVKTPVGDTTETTTQQVIEGALFEPERRLTERTTERVTNSRVPVVQPAVWNLPGDYAVDSDDRIIEGDATVDGFDEDTAVVWEVIGQGDVWLDRTKVPVKKTRDV